MRIELEALPEGLEAQVEGNRAMVTYGDPEAPTALRIATDGAALILFPERAYKHDDLVKALGLDG